MVGSKLFGTDGIRGRANSKTMNAEVAMAVGRATAYFVRNMHDELPQIVIGKDTRRSGYMLESALASGITSMGIDVLKTGPLPTPGVAFICRSMRARLGIVISASHNPADHNGIKLFNYNGIKLTDEQEAKIEDLIQNNHAEEHLASPGEIGKITQIDGANGRYIQFLKERFPQGLTLKGLRVVVDTANGAAYDVAPSVFSELGADVITVNNEPNGMNINVDCGALYPEAVAELVKKHRADVGISLDGDADRVILSDENGNIVDGDGILFICARHLHSKGNLGQATVVGTVMTNYGLDMALKEEGISVARTDVGDNNVISYMRRHKINLGGESSGHLIFLHHSPTGDGVLGALRILSVMRQKNRPLSEIIKPYKPFPQKTINVRVCEKIDFDRIREIAETRNEITTSLEGKGRAILRYSGTEMVARVTVEADDELLTCKLAEHLASTVHRHIGV